MKNNQRGSSMVEMVLVIGFIGVLGIGIMKAISSVYSKYQANAIIWEIRQLHKNISAYFSSGGYYDELNLYNAVDKMKNVDELVKKKIIPNEFVSGGQIVHSSGGIVTMKAISTLSANYRCVKDCIEYEINFANVPTRECIDLAMLNWLYNDSSTVIAIRINNFAFVEWSYLDKVAGKEYLPMTPPMALKMCNKATNNITWWYQ